MRILHTESSCGWGGQEIRILEEAEGLARRGHDLLIATPPESRLYPEAQKRGFAVRALPIARKNFAGWRALRTLLKTETLDLVNTHSSTDSWLVALARIGLKSAPSVIRTRHISAPIPDNFLTRWLYNRGADHVVTTGEVLRRQVIEQSGADPARVTSVPTGIDLARFRPGDRAAARVRLGLPAEAFLVGTGPMEQNIRRKVAEDGLASRVIMAGHHDDVVPWLQSFDVFALPSYANEGVPQAIMQAMACGLAVVTTGVGAIGEAARDGVTALIVRPRDAGALAAGISLLRDDPAQRARLGAAAATEARARFSRDAMLDRMEAVFQSAVDESRGGPTP